MSLSYSEQAQSCSASPTTAEHTQHCHTSSSSTKGCSSPRHKVWGLTQINPFSPETPNQRSSRNLLLKQSQEQRTEVGGGICSENSNVSKPEAPHERNFSPGSSRFSQTEEQTCSYFQPLYQTEKTSFQNEVLSSSLAYLLSAPEHIHGGENHPAGLQVSGKITEERAERMTQPCFLFLHKKR